MSQFGYAEEQGENKARPDIYAVISPPLVPPGIQHYIERMLLHVIRALLRLLLESPIYLFTVRENNLEERRCKKWGW